MGQTFNRSIVKCDCVWEGQLNVCFLSRQYSDKIQDMHHSWTWSWLAPVTKKKMTEIRPIGPVCSSWTGKPPLSKVTSFKLELLLMDNLGLVVWGLDLVRILEFNLVSCEKHCWYVHGLYVIQHWYYFMWKPNLWHDFWHSSVQKQMNYPTKKAQKMNKDLCRISFISFFFFFLADAT